MTWRGIVGKGFTADKFEQYVHTLQFGHWQLDFVVVHNTSSPTLAEYRAWKQRHPPITGEQWMKNLVRYYRDQQHWSAGPHLFVADDKIWAFTPLTVPGTHTPSWNPISWGVETVGDFGTEPIEGSVRDNLVAALASLHKRPSKKMVKPALVKAVVDKMTAMNSGEHLPERPPGA